MFLTTAQIAIVKANILATPVYEAFAKTGDGAQAIADLYNAPVAPVWNVWKTSVSEQDIVSTPSPLGTLFSWTAYINRSEGERAAWGRLFAMGGMVNPSLPNIQTAINDIFSGAGQIPVDQRAHIFSCFKRTATVLEKLLSTGVGSVASPATMGFWGPVTYQDIERARV